MHEKRDRAGTFVLKLSLVNDTIRGDGDGLYTFLKYNVRRHKRTQSNIYIYEVDKFK